MTEQSPDRRTKVDLTGLADKIGKKNRSRSKLYEIPSAAMVVRLPASVGPAGLPAAKSGLPVPETPTHPKQDFKQDLDTANANLLNMKSGIHRHAIIVLRAARRNLMRSIAGLCRSGTEPEATAIWLETAHTCLAVLANSFYLLDEIGKEVNPSEIAGHAKTSIERLMLLAKAKLLKGHGLDVSDAAVLEDIKQCSAYATELERLLKLLDRLILQAAVDRLAR